MRIFLPILAFLIPAIGMMSGLAAAPLITVFLLILLLNNFNQGKLLQFVWHSNKVLWKLESIFCLWCFASCLWSSDIVSSLSLYFQVFSIIFIGLILSASEDLLSNNDIIKISYSLMLGVLVAIILFLIEYSSHGVISRNFRNFFQPESNKQFFLHLLDRGCALLSVTSWILIGILIHNKKHLFTITLYLSVLFVLVLSDSLASLVGFIIASCAFAVFRFFTTKLFRVATLVLIIGSMVMPIFAYQLAPREVSNKYYTIIPDSAKHRLFIWNFVANKAAENPILGFGFGASKIFRVKDNEMIDYDSYKFSPLPLHPHNNILQIWLETGLVGLVLFLLIIYKFLRSLESTNKSGFSVISYCCFINYYTIGLISFSVWQIWWVCVGVFMILMIKLQGKLYSLR